MKEIPSRINTTQETYVDKISFIYKTRFAKGRKNKIPYFQVKLPECYSQECKSEFAYVSIAKYGWSVAWKKALQSSVSANERNKIVRFLNRPPMESEFLVKVAL